MWDYFKDLGGLVFPRTCQACGKGLFAHEEQVCNLCWISLPRTHFHHDPGNPVSQVFWGRVMLEQASACFYYARGNKVQRLIHGLKYRGAEELGYYLGERYGQEIKKHAFLEDADILIPVPLHPAKLKKRGYNQSEAIAGGLAKALRKEVWTDQLYRLLSSETQTRKTRYHRWQNVEHIFGLRDAGKLSGKHLVLVDDVVTTGATSEACIRVLQQAPGVRVSLLALAFASR